MSTLIVYNESVSEERPFTCAVCLETFKHKSSVKHHVTVKKHFLHQPNKALLENLQVILPKNWKYGAYQLDTNNSSLTFLIYDLHTKDDVVTWLKLYMDENNSKFVCRQVQSAKTKKVIRYQCEHWKDCNRDHKKKKIKGTGCKCAIHFSLSRGLASVKISHLHHNHSLTSAIVKSFYRPTEYVKQIFLEMFNGVGPAEALNHYKNHIKNQNLSDIEYIEFSIDKSKMPSYDWVKHLYQAQVKGKYGSTRNYEVMEELKRYIECVHSEGSDPIFKYKEVGEGNFVLVIMTSLMKHICSTAWAGELMFVDSIGSIDRFGLRIFILKTKLNIGGIPMGILITSNETVNIITEALSLFLEFITDDYFGGRGRIGPSNMITDDNSNEIMALHNTFPASQTWLCTFRILQCVYKWLWKAENGISHTERCDIYNQVKNMMYAKNAENIKNGFDYIVLRYNGNARLMKYINQLYRKKEKWCLYFRDGVIERGSVTDNIIEHGIRTLKENILYFLKAQSPAQLLSYLTKEYTEFYSNKIISFVFKNNITVQGNTQQSDSDYDIIEDEKLSSLLIVISQKTGTKYSVNLDVGICSCFVGCSGAYCKHQRFLNSRIGAFSNLMCSVLLDEEERVQLCHLAIGGTSVPKYYCSPLNSILSKNEEPEIEVVEVLVQHCEDIEFTAPLSDAENDDILDSEQEEAEREVRKSLKNWENLCQIMLRNPTMYTSALKFFNKHLTEMSNNHNKIIPRLFSINNKKDKAFL